MSLAIQDRTHEFKSCVDSIRNRTALSNRGAEAKQRLLQGNTKSRPKSEFSQMASSIGKEISSTSIKLNKLAQRAFGYAFAVVASTNYIVQR